MVATLDSKLRRQRWWNHGASYKFWVQLRDLVLVTKTRKQLRIGPNISLTYSHTREHAYHTFYFLIFLFVLHTNHSLPIPSSPASHKHTPIHSSEMLRPPMVSHQSLAHSVESEASPSPARSKDLYFEVCILFTVILNSQVSYSPLQGKFWA